MRESANVKVQCLLTGKSHAASLPDTNLCMKPFLKWGVWNIIEKKLDFHLSLSFFLGEKKLEFLPKKSGMQIGFPRIKRISAGMVQKIYGQWCGW